MKKFQLMIVLIIMAVSAPTFASTGSLEAGINADLGIEMENPHGKKPKKKKKAKKQKAEKAEKKAKKQKAKKAAKEESDI